MAVNAILGIQRGTTKSSVNAFTCPVSELTFSFFPSPIREVDELYFINHFA